MASNETCDVKGIEEAICRYLSDRPLACDTAIGIWQIWLQRRYPLEGVQSALENLALRGAIRTRTIAGMRYGRDVLYSAHRSG